jgi:hypothetical protein
MHALEKRHQTGKAASVAVTLLVLAACGGLEKDATYESVDNLRSAFEKAGWTCEDWQQLDQIDAAVESGVCGDYTVLSIWQDENDAMQGARSLFETMEPFQGDQTQQVLVGPNWIINDRRIELSQLQNKLGGEVVTAPEPESEPDVASPDEDLVGNAEAFKEVAVLEVPALEVEDAATVYAAASGGVCPALFDGKQLAKDVLSDGSIFTSASLSDAELEAFIRVSAEELCPENLGSL